MPVAPTVYFTLFQGISISLFTSQFTIHKSFGKKKSDSLHGQTHILAVLKLAMHFFIRQV